MLIKKSLADDCSIMAVAVRDFYPKLNSACELSDRNTGCSHCPNCHTSAGSDRSELYSFDKKTLLISDSSLGLVWRLDTAIVNHQPG